MQQDILEGAHDSPSAGHFGAAKTLARIQGKYYWNGMIKMIKQYARECKICQMRNRENRKKQGELQYIIREEPFELIGIDIVGPLPTTTRGNKYIITAIDIFTRYGITESYATVTCFDVATFLVNNLICIYGIPKTILTDRGTPFMAGLTKEMMKQLGVKHSCTTAYHPQCNGCVEHFNGTLKDMISKYVNTAQDNWDTLLPLLTFAYNTAQHSATGFTPYKLLFGRDATTISDATLEATFSTYSSTEDNVERSYVDKLNIVLHRTREAAKRTNLESKMREAAQYNKNRRKQEYEIGEKVLVKNPLFKKGLSHKLMQRYVGPYTVIEKIAPLVYKGEMILPSGSKKIDSLPVSLMKPYHERIPIIPIPPTTTTTSTIPPDCQADPLHSTHTRRSTTSRSSSPEVLIRLRNPSRSLVPFSDTSHLNSDSADELTNYTDIM